MAASRPHCLHHVRNRPKAAFGAFDMRGALSALPFLSLRKCCKVHECLQCGSCVAAIRFPIDGNYGLETAIWPSYFNVRNEDFPELSMKIATWEKALCLFAGMHGAWLVFAGARRVVSLGKRLSNNVVHRVP